MIGVSLLSVAFGLISAVILIIYREMSLLILFEKSVQFSVTLLVLWTFLRVHWDATKGMLGGLLFCLMFREAFLVLGSFWADTANFDAYLIMGVEGSLFLAAQTMSFMMTVIIIVNHFIIDYSPLGSYTNLVFNRVATSSKSFCIFSCWS